MSSGMECSSCGGIKGRYSEPEANGEQWWTCDECGDEWLVPAVRAEVPE